METVQGKDHKKSIQKINLSKKSAKCTSCESASRVKHIFSCHQKHNLLPATSKKSASMRYSKTKLGRKRGDCLRVSAEDSNQCFSKGSFRKGKDQADQLP